MSVHSQTPDREAVEATLRAWDAALFEKDLARLVTAYTDASRSFDVSAEATGAAGVKALWEPCLEFFGEHIGIERKEVDLRVSGDLALLSCYCRMIGMQCDAAAARSWLRSTVVLQRIEVTWKIIHEHSSFPFDCQEEKPAYLLD